MCCCLLLVLYTHAAATSSTLDADWLQRAGALAAAKRPGGTETAETTKKQKFRKTNQMTALIGTKKIARWKWSSGNPDDN
jgi:hypothetical protein